LDFSSEKSAEEVIVSVKCGFNISMEAWVSVISTPPVKHKGILLNLNEVCIIVCDEPVSRHWVYFVRDHFRPYTHRRLLACNRIILSDLFPKEANVLTAKV